MTEDTVERNRKAIKRRRGDLIDLDYYRLANNLVASETIEQETHKRIKTQCVSDSSRMDELLDHISASESEEIFQSFLVAVEKQNNELAQDIRQDAQFDDEIDIYIASDIFCSSQVDEASQGEVLNESIDSVIQSTPSPFQQNQQRTQTHSQERVVTSFPSDSQFWESSSSSTQSQGFPLTGDKTYSIQEICQHLHTGIRTSRFFVETAWVHHIDTYRYYTGKDMVYKGCSFPYENKGHCKKKVEQKNPVESFYKCSLDHRMSTFISVPMLKVRLEDSSRQINVTLFGSNVEKLLDYPENVIEIMNHDDVLRCVNRVRTFNFSIIINCQRRSLVRDDINMGWDMVATIKKRRVVGVSNRHE